MVSIMRLQTQVAISSTKQMQHRQQYLSLIRWSHSRTHESRLDAIILLIHHPRSCLIAFQNIVPISLYISIEIVKTIQAYFISQDIDMYYKTLDAPCVPKTWNISDDLGQIAYIFSDKTG